MIPLLVVLIFLSACALAEEIPEVQITATRVEVPEDHVGDDITIIKEETIKEREVSSIVDILRFSPGMIVTTAGGWGKQSSVFPMGLDSKYLLVLVDGIPVNDPSSPDSSANFEWIPALGIERIELLKGPQSSLYGSEAVGGVVNLITGKTKGTRISLEGGSRGTFRETFSWGDSLDHGYLSFSAQHFKTLGRSATNERAGVWVFDPDRDPFLRTSAFIGAGYEPSQELKIKVSTISVSGYTDYDRGTTNYDRLFTGIDVLYLQSDSILWNLKLGSNEEKRRYTGFFFDGAVRYFLLAPTLYTGETSFFKAGLSYRHESAETSAYPCVRDKNFVRSAFLEGHHEKGGFGLTWAVRIDDHRAYSSHRTYKVSVARALKRAVLKAQYGTGFRAPSLSQLYGYFEGPWGKVVGNPDLEPEKSEGWVIGLVLKPLRAMEMNVNYFKNRVWNIIESYYDANKGATTYRNAGKEVTEGTEMSFSLRISKPFEVFGSYMHLNGRIKSGNTSRRLPRRPGNSLTLGMRAKTKKEGITLWMHFYGRREDTDWSGGTPRRVTLPSFVTFNCYAYKLLTKRLKLYARGINLTGREYELAYGYNTPGRSLFAGIEISF